MKAYNNIDSLPNDLNTVYRIDLSEQDLTQLPKIIFKLENLQELDISNNQLTDLKGIDALKKIQILNIGMNKFNIFPIELTELKNLKVLNICWNNLKTFPDKFYTNNLQIEELDMTSMFEFDFKTNLHKIHLLKNLRQLNLGNNQIPQLTIQFDKLDNLEVFGYIRQDQIDLKEICVKLSNCKKLKKVHFSSNNLTMLPEEITQLENLETLNLFQNKLKSLPFDIVKMKKLKEITLIDNPIHEADIKYLEKKMPETKIIY